MPVIIHTRTGTCRSFKNYDLAFLWLQERKDHLKYLFTEPNDFNRIGNAGREVLYPRLEDWADWRWRGRGKTPKRLIHWHDFVGRGRDEQNKYLWSATNHIADPVTVPPQWMGGQGLTIDLDRCRELMLQKKWVMMDLKAPNHPPRERYPAKQLTEMVKLLETEDRTYLTEGQLQELVQSYTATKMLDTRQDNWRIFRYYRPILEQLKVLR